MTISLSLMFCVVVGVALLVEMSLKKCIFHPAILVFWIISPCITFFAGAGMYNELLQRNHLEVYHEIEYIAAAGLVASFACVCLTVIVRPLLQKLFPRLVGKLRPVYWVIAAYIVPVVVMLIVTAIEGLPWDQQLPVL